MRYKNLSVLDYRVWGYNPIHLFGDYYLLRKHSIYNKKYSCYTLAKIPMFVIDSNEYTCAPDLILPTKWING